MIYSFFCNKCGQEYTFSQYHPIGQPLPRRCHCGGVILRGCGTLHYNRPMREHYNLSSQTYVDTKRKWDDDIKRKADEMSERTGMEHRYREIDPDDPLAAGVTTEGLEDTARRKVIDLDPLF